MFDERHVGQYEGLELAEVVAWWWSGGQWSYLLLEKLEGGLNQPYVRLERELGEG